MEHFAEGKRLQMTGFIEVLNDIGFNLLYIDKTFYVFTEFEPADPSSGINYITVIGRNVTFEVENAVQKEGYTERIRIELFQKIESSKPRRREFSPDTEWRKYLTA